MAYAIFARWEQDDETLVFGPYPEFADAKVEMRALLASYGVADPDNLLEWEADEVTWSDGDSDVWIAPMKTFAEWQAANTGTGKR